MRRIGDVELSEDMRHERREWIAQRVAWGVMALVVAAAVAGLFGSGPLATARAETPGLAVEYPRFARDDAESRIALRLDGRALWLGREAADEVTVEAVTPPPAAVRVDGDRWVYEWTSPPRRVVLKVRPTRVGHVELRVGAVVDGGDVGGGAGELRIASLVFP